METSSKVKQVPESSNENLDSVLASLRIHSVAGVAHLGLYQIPLRRLCKRTVNCELRCGQLRMRLVEPASTARIYANGTMNVLGCRSVDDCRVATRRYARIVQIAGYDVKLRGYRVTTIYGDVRFKHHIDLQGLARENCQRVYLESDQSTPGFLRLSLSDLLESDHSVTASISHRGIVQMMGTQSVEELHNAVRLLYPIVVKHLKKPREGTFVPRELRNILCNSDSSVRL